MGRCVASYKDASKGVMHYRQIISMLPAGVFNMPIGVQLG